MMPEQDGDISFDFQSCIDPDINLIPHATTCNYYDQDQFLDKFKFNRDMKLLHISARSLKKNISNIHQYLELTGDSFSVIGITETWLKDINDPLIKIPCYSMEGFCRQNKRGGGVALYIKEEYNYTIRSDLCSTDTLSIETCFIEVENSTTSNIIIEVVYKPPDVPCYKFTEVFNDILRLANN